MDLSSLPELIHAIIPWNTHHKTFTIHEAQVFCDKLHHIAETGPYLAYIILYIHSFITDALHHTSEYLITTNHQFCMLLEQIKCTPSHDINPCWNPKSP